MCKLISFPQGFPWVHENRIIKEEGKVNVNSDSIDALADDFFSKLASKTRESSRDKTKKTKESNS